MLLSSSPCIIYLVLAPLTQTRVGLVSHYRSPLAEHTQELTAFLKEPPPELAQNWRRERLKVLERLIVSQGEG